MTDKAAKKRGANSAGEVIDLVNSSDMAAGTALDVCRQVTNDVKHPKTQPQTFSTRDRTETDETGVHQLPSWIYTDKSGVRHELCDIAQRGVTGSISVMKSKALSRSAVLGRY